MATLDDQLPAIDRLRAQRDDLGQQMYALRTQIARGATALQQSKQAGSKRGAPDPADIATRRAEIADLETSLRTLSSNEQTARATIAQVDVGNQRIAFLQQSLQGYQSALDQLESQIGLAQSTVPVDRSVVAAIQAQIDTTIAKVSDTKASLAAATAAQAGIEQAATAAKATLQHILTDTTNTRKSIDDKEAEIGALQGPAATPPQEIQAQLAALNKQFAGTKGSWQTTTATLHDAIKGIYVDTHPRSTVAQMGDGTPFVLLPVRIETRFVSQPATAAGVAASPELWVRVYPDDIAVHTHENELTDREVSAGEDYWRAIFGIEQDADGGKPSRKSETWKNFAPLFGPSRSAWVARQTRPTNWGSLPTLATTDDLTFPPHDLTKTSSWTRAPRTTVLPDRFVVMLYSGETIVKEVVGEGIPDELFVGPEPLDLTADADQTADDSSFVTVDGQLTFGPSYDWASNFDRAVSVGMGVRIPITAAQLRTGFDKILVLGVMASASATTGETELETLLANHQHSPKGLTLLAQGTATNNVDGDGSGYSINDALAFTQEVTGLDVPLFGGNSTSDGRRLTDGLGITDETLQFVYNSDNTDFTDAVAMNTALYPATLGYYFDTLLDPLVPEAARDGLRDFFVNNVTGRGPLPGIRVGDQPYGVLLTSDFTAWKEQAIVARSDPFRTTLYRILQYFDAVWSAIIPQLMFAGKTGVAPDTMLMNVLGLQAGSVTFAQRIGYALEYLANLVSFQDGGPEADRLIATALRGFTVSNLLRHLAGIPAGDTSPYEITQLVFQSFTTALDATNVIDAVPLSESAEIRDYDTTAHKNYLDWLHDAASVDVLSSQNFGGAPVPGALLYLQARHALILQLHKSAVLWMRGKNVDASDTLLATTFHNVRPAGDLTRWEVLRTPVGLIDSTNPFKASAVADFLLQPTVSIIENAYLSQMRTALDTLARLSTARLERCFTEHIDACTYRLDAWQTALFKGRLDTLRGVPAQQDVPRKRGAYIGAFGWVENVKPSPSTLVVSDIPEKLKSPKGNPIREYADNGGFIHAPSINHATAAAVLRAGYMSHATNADPDVMAVNLTSERVRRAMFILEGMRNGQAVEALLGYQFERGIHDRASADSTLDVLNSLIFDIRIAFPIQRVRIAAGDAGGAQEIVPSYDVVNGLTLAETPTPDWAAIAGTDAAVLNPSRIAALNDERDKLADTLDAVNDLLLSEGAYQMVQADFDRAGAVLGSIKDAYVPPDIDVVKTPRSSRLTFTNRIAVHFARLDPTDPAAAVWPAAMSPRALTEPGINLWLGTLLGDPRNIIMRASELQDDGTLVGPATLAATDLGLQPADLVSMVGADANSGNGGRTGASELEMRVAWRYRADHGLDETARVQIEFSAPAGQAGKLTMGEAMPLMLALQGVISDSRPLDSRDYHTATTQGGTPASGSSFPDVRSRAAAVQAQLDGVISIIRGLPFTATIGSVAVTTIGQAFDEITSQDADVDTLAFTFAVGETVILQQQLFQLAAFGMPDAFPRTQDVTRETSKTSLIAQAMDATIAGAARVADCAALLTSADAAAPTANDKAVGLASDACKAILGQSFPVIPAFALATESEVMQSHADHAQLVDHAVTALSMAQPEDEWIRGVAYVRQKVAAWERIRLLSETLFAMPLSVSAVQLPYRGQDSWLAVGLPDIDPATGKPFDISADTLSMVTHGDAAYAAGTLRTGILIDSWTETVPSPDQSTGIAFNYNRPNAMPPQAVLLAVPPEVTGHWSWDALVGILNDTLRRAKMRAVEPLLLDQRTANPELSVLLPAVISEFQQYALNVSLDFRLNLSSIETLSAFYVNPNLLAAR